MENKSISQESKRHHYIPIFYSKQWAGSDGRLCEFSRKDNTVKPRMTHPRGTGYEFELYTVPGLPPETRAALEDKFMKKTDQLANDAHKLLLKNQINELTVEARSAWTRFILSLVHRTPEKVIWAKEQVKNAMAVRMAEIEKDYTQFRLPNYPATFEEFKAKLDTYEAQKGGALLIQKIIDSRNVGSFINQMRWSVVTFERLDYPLLTSDRPVIMTDGIKYQNSQIVMPMSPTQLFVAVNTVETEQQLKNIRPKDLAKRVNDRAVSQAQKYVYGTDDQQIQFVENRLGKGSPQFIGSNVNGAEVMQKIMNQPEPSIHKAANKNSDHIDDKDFYNISSE